jgi:hypothetical protein|tara:strand:+ start:1454 stop:2125 length:672 start_codon:yes stop_codon:yes gene_type:complete
MTPFCTPKKRKIYFVVTTCVEVQPVSVRKEQYAIGISSLQHQIRKLNITDYIITLVDCGHERSTFLDKIKNVRLYYADTQRLRLEKGVKEIKSIKKAIKHLGMSDDNLIVKMTGRYRFAENSPFMNILATIDRSDIRAIVKWGPYFKPTVEPPDNPDCTTGLIMSDVSTVRLIEEKAILEHRWAQSIMELPPKKVVSMNTRLGLYIAPGGNNFVIDIVPLGQK